MIGTEPTDAQEQEAREQRIRNRRTYDAIVQCRHSKVIDGEDDSLPFFTKRFRVCHFCKLLEVPDPDYRILQGRVIGVTRRKIKDNKHSVIVYPYDKEDFDRFGLLPILSEKLKISIWAADPRLRGEA